MDTLELRKWANEKNVTKRTFDGFHICFQNYLSEDSDEFTKYFGQYDKKKMKVFFYKVELKFVSLAHLDPENNNHEFIEAYLRIEYNGEYIGWYSLLFDFSGDTFDDFLVWDWKVWYIFQRLDILYELNDEINKELDNSPISGECKDFVKELITDKIQNTRSNII